MLLLVLQQTALLDNECKMLTQLQLISSRKKLLGAEEQERFLLAIEKIYVHKNEDKHDV